MVPGVVVIGLERPVACGKKKCSSQVTRDLPLFQGVCVWTKFLSDPKLSAERAKMQTYAILSGECGCCVLLGDCLLVLER